MNDKEVTSEATRLLRGLKALLVITAFLLTIIIVIVIGLEVQVQSRNADLHKIKTTQQETKAIVSQAEESSRASERAINDAIAQSHAASAANAKFVEDLKAGLLTIQANGQKLDRILEHLEGQ